MTLLLKIIRFYRYWFLSQLLYGYIFFMRWNFFLRLPLMNLVSLCIKGISTYISNYNYPILYKRLNILFLKIEQLRLESGLSLAFKRNIYITLQNIFNLNIYFDFIKFSKKKKINTSVQFLTTLEFMTYLTCKLRFSSILARFIAKQLSFEKKHKSLLWQIARIVKMLNNRLSLFNGLKLYVTGKLNGKMRRQAYSFKLGKLPLQKIESNLDFCKTTSFTKFGTISIKLWLVF